MRHTYFGLFVLWIVLGLGFMGWGLLGHVWKVQTDLLVYPAYLFNDQDNGGDTRAQQDSIGKTLHWTLGHGFAFPYAIFGRKIGDSLGNCPSFRPDAQLMIQADVQGQPMVRTSLRTWKNNWSKPESPLSFPPFHARWDQDLAQGAQHLISNHTVPDWWKLRYPTGPVDWENPQTLCYVEFIVSGEPGQSGQAKIHNLALVQSLISPMASGICFGIGLLFCALAGIHKVHSRRLVPSAEQQELPTVHDDAQTLREAAQRAAEPEPDAWITLKSCLEKNFADPNLDLYRLSQLAGLGEGRVSTLIRDHTGLRFKALLNQMRMSHALRLLQEGSETVAAIAHKSGYAHATHFNRIFKQEQGMSPSEWRAAHKINSSDPRE